MARQYVVSTPATRGEVEVDEDAHASLIPEGVSHEEAVEALKQVAAELGLELVPLSAEKLEDQKPEDEPAGNASTEAWVEFAKKRGAQDSDLVDDKGEALNRSALIEKYGTPAAPPA